VKGDRTACFLHCKAGRLRNRLALQIACAVRVVLRNALRPSALLALLPALALAPAMAQNSAPNQEELQFVLFLSRHGVRSPTGKASKYAKYSSAAWPEWDVPPGYLTPHGYALMKLFGVYDRAKLAAEGLLAPSGCADAAHITILADSDQRTRETGKALSEGLLPGCDLAVRALPEGTADPLFHSMEAGVAHPDSNLAAAAIAGRIGGDANNLTAAYRPQLATLDRLLTGCGKVASTNSARTSLFDVPASLAPGDGDHPAELLGPLDTASSLAENLLLEYTDGMSGTNLGWGCLDEATLLEVVELHAAQEDFEHRTPAVARMYASTLLDCIGKALEQSATGKPAQGAPGKPGDLILFLVGHDTNIATVAGALGLDWIVNGRRGDTPPGGALVFELWRTHASGRYSVRVHYTAQTLDQMREMQPLTLANPPADASVFVPGCSRADLSCDLEDFLRVLTASATTASGETPPPSF
jgi:4-phytase / acid phosphatase